MNDIKPLHKSNLILKDLGDEFLVYSAEHKELHVMNPTAHLIWELCDGEHSIVDIADEIRAHFSIPEARNIRDDVQKTVEIFQNKGLLEIKSNATDLGWSLFKEKR